MKRWPRALGTATSFLVIGAGIAIWYAAYRAPSPRPLPVPSDLIAIETRAGQQLLADRRYLVDYAPLTRHFEAQSRPAFCGVASSVMILNALARTNAPFTQANFFTSRTDAVRKAWQVTFAGMTLGQFADLLRAHDVDVTTHHAADVTLDGFRTIVAENLSTPGDFLVVNYSRAVLGQTDTGHISPVGAYEGRTDRVLILDVASYKYPPVWVATEALWHAMNTVDSASGRTRGFAVVHGLRDAPGQRVPPS